MTKLTTRQANTEILGVGESAGGSTFQGVIRQQDVRKTEIDRVVLYNCFRPGDIVRAEVVAARGRVKHLLKELVALCCMAAFAG